MNWLQLRNMVSSFASRGDLSAEVQAMLLPLAEERIYSGLVGGGKRIDGLRLQVMLDSVNPFTAGALPTGSLAIERLSHLSGARWVPLEYRTSDQLSGAELQAGGIASYTVRGGAVVVGPNVAGDLWLLHYVRPPAPALDADENVVMAACPRVYLYAMLAEVANWLRSAEMLAQYQGMLVDALQAAQGADDDARRGSVPMRIVSC